MKAPNSSFKEIPIIDVSSLVDPRASGDAINQTAKEIDSACKHVGFFYVKNHQIPEYHLDQVVQTMNEFFALSEDEKMKIHINKSNIFRGYTPLGKEVTNDKYDWHECIDFGLDLPMDHPDVISKKQLMGSNQ